MCVVKGSNPTSYEEYFLPLQSNTCGTHMSDFFLVKEEHKKAIEAGNFSCEGRTEKKKASEAGNGTQEHTHAVA